MEHLVYAIEGIDRLGKSTLIDSIQQKYGYYQTVHFEKPRRLKAYEPLSQAWIDSRPDLWGNNNTNLAQRAFKELQIYQEESFRNSMKMALSGARLIYDRWHLGECVYAPLYRQYSGDYVFELEKTFNLMWASSIRLILLTENFAASRHFVDDGESFDPMKREQEQVMFLAAFERSIIRDKKIICVTDTKTGLFRSKESILEEATL